LTQETGEEDRMSNERMDITVSPVNYCFDTECELTGAVRPDSLIVGGHQQRGGDASTDSVDSSCEPVPDACNDLPSSTALERRTCLLSSQSVDSSVIIGESSVDRMTSGEVMCEPADDRQGSYEIVYQQYSTGYNVVRDRYPTTGSGVPPSDQNGAQCHDWQFFATWRVDVPLLLDILLARKHRDRTAREFLLNLPASVLKKYEVFGRQNPVFVCLDIVK